MNKKIILLCIGFVIILICICLFFVIPNLNFNNVKVTNVSNLDEAYDVKTCTNKFYLYCKTYMSSSKKSVYELLDREYIKKYHLNSENFNEKIKEIKSDTLEIKSIYKLQESNNISLYMVNSYELYQNSDDQKEFNLLIKLDYKNNTFSVYLEDYIDDNKYNNLNLGDNVKIKLKSVKKQNDNIFSKKSEINNLDDYISDFKSLCIFYRNYAYSLLDEEVKNEKFRTFQEFNNYISDNLSEILSMKLVAFELQKNNDYEEYICSMSNGIKINFKTDNYVSYVFKIR